MSLVNQMLRDLELRQSGQLAADGALLCDIGAVHEPLPASTRHSPWRLVGIVLATAMAAVLLATMVDARWLLWPQAATPAGGGDRAGFVSAVRPAPSGPTPPVASVVAASPEAIAVTTSPPLGVAHASDTVSSAGVDPRSRASAAPSGRPALRFVRELGAVPASAEGMAAAPLPAGTGKASLPEDLSAIAARFDRDFAASLTTAGEERGSPPSRSVVVAAPLKVKSATPRTTAERGEELYAVAAAALAAGRRDAAENDLGEVLRIEPAHDDARRLLASMLLQSGRLQAADRLLADAPVASPELAGLRARVLVELGRDAEALAVLEPSVDASADINQHAFHAALLQRLGDHAAASAAYRRVLAVQPDNGVWWMGLGISLEALQQPADARLAYDRARASGRLQQALAEFVERRLAML